MAAIQGTGLDTKGIRSNFYEALAASQNIWSKIVTVLPSDSSSETYKWMGAAPRPRLWGTGRVTQGMISESYTVTNNKYEATIEIDQDEIDDDQTGQIGRRASELGSVFGVYKDQLLADLLVNGDVAGNNSYDGVSFFNSSHPIRHKESAAQDNLLVAGDDARLTVTSTTAVTTAEHQGILEALFEQMATFVDDQNRPLNMLESGRSTFLYLVPVTYYWKALEAVNSTLISNTTNQMNGFAEVAAMPHLDIAGETTVVYLIRKVNNSVGPFIWQARSPVELTISDAGDDRRILTDKYLVAAKERGVMTYGRWQYAIHATLST